ncbi:hypothetical protein [Natronoglomus mannanivorans]|uniref:Uncharacterized protein n=1 Tax=Natronoglomus mannanivorans TaxID=2979990 RepID=A0AAP3E0X8_9EURY|nr:hypothetical protein [Halobacteria archaeon AArc-xg1-1]
MYDDDSRGLESPDRPQVSTDVDTRVRPDGGDPSSNDTGTEPTHPNDVDPDAASYRLEVIDQQAKRLLEELATDRADRAGRKRPHEAVRHLREIRAEVEWARRGLCERPREPNPSTAGSTAESDDGGAVDGRDAVDGADDSPKGTDDSVHSTNAPHRNTGDVPMIVRRGPHVTTVLGPDPVAYERSLEAADRDESEDASDLEDGDDSEDPDLEDADRETDADGDRDADGPNDEDDDHDDSGGDRDAE